MTKNVPELFGSMVFNDEVMKERLPKDIYKALQKTIADGLHLQLDVANVVAAAMKDWAIEKGSNTLYPLVPANDRRDRRKA